jgi:hypothetical protein
MLNSSAVKAAKDFYNILAVLFRKRNSLLFKPV